MARPTSVTALAAMGYVTPPNGEWAALREELRRMESPALSGTIRSLEEHLSRLQGQYGSMAGTLAIALQQDYHPDYAPKPGDVDVRAQIIAVLEGLTG